MKSKNYWIATTRPDGRPHVDARLGRLVERRVVLSARTGHRSRRAICRPIRRPIVHLESGDECVILEGAAREITDAAEIAADRCRVPPEVQNEINRRSRRALHRSHRSRAWRSHGTNANFPESATRWEFGARGTARGEIMIYQLNWKTLPGLKGLSCSDFKATPTSAPNTEGRRVRMQDEAECADLISAPRCAFRRAAIFE